MGQLSPPTHQTVRRVAFVGAALLVTIGHISAAWAQGQIFVTNYSSDSVTVYSRNANGDVAPSYTIFGQLGDGPHQIAIDHSARGLIVTNFLSNSVAVYDAATGALRRKISGAATGLNGPVGVAVDEVKGEIYVTNFYGNSITVYDATATGDVQPNRTIQSTDLAGPVGIAIDLTQAEIVVAVEGFHSIATFDLNADGVSPTKRLIKGGSTGLLLPIGVALDLVSDEILVANSAFQTPNSGAILVFRRGDTGDVAPIRALEGSATNLCNPMSVALDRAADELVVANSNEASGSCAQSVTTYSRTASGNIAPKRTLAGAFTSLDFPASAAITSASSVTLNNKAADPSIKAGDDVGYTITATARGGPVFNVVLFDMLPSGLTWSVTANVNTCTLSAAPENTLTCSVQKLAKGESLTIQALAKSTNNNCPKIVNQATVFYNDGTADVEGPSQRANITIKCK